MHDRDIAHYAVAGNKPPVGRAIAGFAQRRLHYFDLATQATQREALESDCVERQAVSRCLGRDEALLK